MENCKEINKFPFVEQSIKSPRTALGDFTLLRLLLLTVVSHAFGEQRFLHAYSVL